MKVTAYRNLNKRHAVVFSVRYRGKVIDYREVVVLSLASFKHPNNNALARIRSGNREVCAWVTGELDEKIPNVDWRKVSCDPKRFDHFQDAETGAVLNNATHIMLNSEGCWYAK